MKKLSTQAPLIREAEEKAMSDLQKDWRDYFGAKLAKFDAKSPADLDEEKKKEFFNELKNDWERGKGATEAGKKDIEAQGVKESVNESSKPKVGDELTMAKDGKKGKVVKCGADMCDVDFGNGDVYGIVYRRIKDGMITESSINEKEITAEELVKKIIKGNSRFKWLNDDLPKNYTLDDVKNALDDAGYGKEYDKYIKEGEEVNEDVNEARSIETVSKDITKLAAEMMDLAKVWKTAEGKAKTEVLDSLKAKTAKKKDLEKELNDLIAGKDKDIELIVMEAEFMNEAEVKTEAEFKEYAEKVLKKAHKDDYDEAKAKKTIDGILKKSDGDLGAAVGMLTSGLA